MIPRTSLHSFTFPLHHSASYAGLKEWEKSIEDAKECIRLHPEFIKGYYRLATAQLELQEFDAAEATVKQGLTVEANNSQLSKTLRTIKQARKAAAAATATGNKGALTANGVGNRPLDTAAARELYDLQMQHSKTAREYNTVQANFSRAQREEKMYSLTRKELEENPSQGEYFRSVGKVFVKSTHPKIMEHLDNNIATQQKKQQEISGKIQYLEKRLKSQQLNMKELTST
jgi:chaperonin cofactor prefoldin